MTLIERFRALHTGQVLVLPNAWDAPSARIVEAAGAAAIATTSGGVAWSMGAGDGGALGSRAALEALARISAAVRVPVTADLEDGYGAVEGDLAALVRDVVALGVVGVNLEDGPHDPAAFAARLRTVRDAVGDALFVNARVDTYLRRVDNPLDESLRRAEMYVAAGADGIFVPGVVDPSAIETLVKGVGVPLNIMAGPGAPPVAELAALGVARVSIGTAMALAAYGLARRAAVEVLENGTYGSMVDGISYGELNGLMTG